MSGGSGSSNVSDGTQRSATDFSTCMNNTFDNSSSLTVAADSGNSNSTNSPSYYVSAFWLPNGTEEGKAISPEGIVENSHNDTCIRLLSR